jgi:hypothetical protein
MDWNCTRNEVEMRGEVDGDPLDRLGWCDSYDCFYRTSTHSSNNGSPWCHLALLDDSALIQETPCRTGGVREQWERKENEGMVRTHLRCP